MRLLADEHVPLSLVRELRARGYDVRRVCEGLSGADDEQVLAVALEDRRVLLTEDFDFGRLVFGLGRPSHGVIIVAMSRFAGSPDERANGICVRVEELADEAVGHLTLIEPGGNRRRRL